ncbi:MAG: uracil-DNA glycosylase [Promethearchaeota archaeon]
MVKKKPCKWYRVCPVKRYCDSGKIDRKWVEEYCLVGNKDCVRYKLEEKGIYHPNNMLPDGSIREDLE